MHSMNIYVGNLPLKVTVDEVRQIFVCFGEVMSVIIMDDKYIGSGQPRVYGYVQMALKSEGAEAVAALQGKNLKGRMIEVIEALPLSDKGPDKAFPVKKGKYSSMKTRER